MSCHARRPFVSMTTQVGVQALLGGGGIWVRTRGRGRAWSPSLPSWSAVSGCRRRFKESTLKVTAPQSPTNAEIVDSATPTLTSTTAAGRFVSGTFEHHFEVSEIAVDGTTTLVETGTVAPTTASTTYTVRTALVNGDRYRLRVPRAREAPLQGTVVADFRKHKIVRGRGLRGLGRGAVAGRPRESSWTPLAGVASTPCREHIPLS